MNLLIHPSTYHDQWAFNQQGYVTVDFDPGKLYRVTPIQQQKLYEYLLFQKKREEP